MDEDQNRPVRAGSPEYYRERARTMLKLADEAGSEETRVSLVLLAATWEELAKQLEHPARHGSAASRLTAAEGR